jgi:DNA polymerase-4
LFESEIKDKMWTLPIGDLYGIGKKSSEKLINLNIKTIGDLANSGKEDLYKYFKNQSEYMINIANGIDSSEVISEARDPKCISHTNTLLSDCDSIEEINIELKRISNMLGNDLRTQGKYANTIAIIIKDKYFTHYTHQYKLKNPTNINEEIYNVSKKLFKDSWNNVPVRLIGIRVDSLTEDNNYQISLFEDVKEKENNEKLDKVIDNLRKKYGDKII